jgi:hypothetical protein
VLFRTGPGSRHVLAGDYQLSNFKNSNHLILDSEDDGLIPGMNVRMAIVMTKLHNSGECCPVPHCGSTTLIKASGGGNIWFVDTFQDLHHKLYLLSRSSECGVWFSEARKIEKRKIIQEVDENSDHKRPRKRISKSSGVPAPVVLDSEDERAEMAAIKNIRVPRPQDASRPRKNQRGVCFPCQRAHLTCGKLRQVLSILMNFLAQPPLTFAICHFEY